MRVFAANSRAVFSLSKVQTAPGTHSSFFAFLIFHPFRVCLYGSLEKRNAFPLAPPTGAVVGLGRSVGRRRWESAFGFMQKYLFFLLLNCVSASRCLCLCVGARRLMQICRDVGKTNMVRCFRCLVSSFPSYCIVYAKSTGEYVEILKKVFSVYGLKRVPSLQSPYCGA